MTSRCDLILRGGMIRTLDPGLPWVSDIAIGGGKVLAIGSAAEALRGPDTVVRDLRGAFVLPGLIDVHNHHALAGRGELFELRLPAGATLDQILAGVRDYAAALSPGAWVTGGAWDSTLLPVLAGPSALRALDDAGSGHPVLLTDDSRHNRWANSQALSLAGLPPTGLPPGSGLLLEAESLAAERALRAARGISDREHVQASRRAIEILHTYGITAFQDAAVSTDIMRALRALDDAGQLRAWVVSSMLINDHIFGFEPTGAALIELGELYRSPHHRPDFVKIFLDGVPPARTAAFLEPYLADAEHSTSFRGEATMTEEELTSWLLRAGQAGLSAKVHCTGDASVRMVLDAVQALRCTGGAPRLMQIAHGQFIAPQDVPRLAALGVSADISPFIWVPGVIPDAIATVLPPERAARMQPNRALLDSGALLAGGSDWPVSPEPNLWYGIAGLVTRTDPAGARAGALWPEQAITLAEAISVFTLSAARAMGIDDVAGSLSPGKSADFVILDRDPFRVPAGSLAEVTVLETAFAGETVFERALQFALRKADQE
jgi:predicted amidohydrolase YtcJ